MILGIDHVAITVTDLDATSAFYTRVLGARVLDTHAPDGRPLVRRIALGGAVLNLHQLGNGLDLVARHVQPGSADICLRWRGPIEDALRALEAQGVARVAGPEPRRAADGVPGRSIYFHDPDGNLIELMGE